MHCSASPSARGVLAHGPHLGMAWRCLGFLVSFEKRGGGQVEDVEVSRRVSDMRDAFLCDSKSEKR